MFSFSQWSMVGLSQTSPGDTDNTQVLEHMDLRPDYSGRFSNALLFYGSQKHQLSEWTIHISQNTPFWKLREQNCCLSFSSVKVCTGRKHHHKGTFPARDPGFLGTSPPPRITGSTWIVQGSTAGGSNPLEKAALARMSLRGMFTGSRR